MYTRILREVLLLILGVQTLVSCVALPQDGAPAAAPNENIGNYIDSIMSGENLAAGPDPSASNVIETAEVVDEPVIDATGIDIGIPILDLNVSTANGPLGSLPGSLEFSPPPITTGNDNTATARRSAALRYPVSGIAKRDETTSYSIFTVFRNTTTGNGYNITLPEGTCSSTVVAASALDPLSGETLTDWTLGAWIYAYGHAKKSDVQWRAFLRAETQNLMTSLTSHIDTGSCDSGLKLKEKRTAGTITRSERRDLILYERDRTQRPQFAFGTGFWTATFLATVPGFGMTFGALAGILSAQHGDHISTTTEALLITVVGFLTALGSNILYRLDIQAAFGRFEIALLGLLTTVGRAIADRLNTCFTGAGLARAIEAYRNRFAENPAAPQQAATPGVADNAMIQMQDMC